MDTNKILSFEEFVQQGTGEMGHEMDHTAEMPQGGEDQALLPAPAEEVEGDETEHNVPNNMQDDSEEGTSDVDPNIEVETSANDIEAHTDENDGF
jgi:hypothetical protein